MIVSVGLDHNTSSLEALEAVTLSPGAAEEVLSALVQGFDVSEAAVISTCMRTEVYVRAGSKTVAIDHIFTVLAKMAGADISLILTEAKYREDEEAVQHLFRVAAGLESAVLGEHEILGQVVRASKAAGELGTSGLVLAPLFQHAIRAGRRARSETDIARGTASIGHAAVAMAESTLGNLTQRRILITGAGEMGKAMGIAATCAKQTSEIVVCNRTFERGQVLAERIGARAVEWSSLAAEIDKADFWLTSTNASEFLVAEADLVASMGRRNGKPLVVVDMGLPRDIDPNVSNVEGVTLFNIAHLRDFAHSTRQERATEIAAVEQVINEELRQYARTKHLALIDPMLRKVYETAESIRAQEVERFLAKRGSSQVLDEEAVNALSRGIVAKLMHMPVSKLKAGGDSSESRRLQEAFSTLFSS